MSNVGQDNVPAADVSTIDLENQFRSPKNKAEQPVTLAEGDRLLLARQTLLCLLFVALFSFGAYILVPENKGAQQVFELVKIGVLPLVTLVIGFYFPNSQK